MIFSLVIFRVFIFEYKTLIMNIVHITFTINNKVCGTSITKFHSDSVCQHHLFSKNIRMNTHGIIQINGKALYGNKFIF